MHASDEGEQFRILRPFPLRPGRPAALELLYLRTPGERILRPAFEKVDLCQRKPRVPPQARGMGGQDELFLGGAVVAFSAIAQAEAVMGLGILNLALPGSLQKFALRDRQSSGYEFDAALEPGDDMGTGLPLPQRLNAAEGFLDLSPVDLKA